MITKSYIGVSKEEFYDLFLQLVDVIQKETNKLTKKQRKIMVEFLALDDQVYKFTRFSSLGKKAVAIKLKEKYNWNLSRRNLDIFVINMTKKGFIEKDADKVKYFNRALRSYMDKVMKSDEPQEFIFKLSVKHDNPS